MNTTTLCDATSAVAITRYKKPATSRALFLAAIAVALLFCAEIIHGGAYALF